jgi:hypothetical protein
MSAAEAGAQDQTSTYDRFTRGVKEHIRIHREWATPGRSRNLERANE